VTRGMLDGINSDAPTAAAAMNAHPGQFSFIAGYVDGLYAWSAAQWALFPHATHVRIAVFASTNDGHVLDCEPGNQGDPGQAVDWVLMRRAAGVDPTVYCGRNTWWPTIRADFRARGVPEPHYWVADYGVDQNNPQIPAGAIALQFADAGPYDLSVVADYWPGVDPKPVPAQAPPKEYPMLIIRTIDGTPDEYAQLDGRYWHIASPADLTTLVAACHAANVPVVNPLHTSSGEHANLLASQQQAATVSLTDAQVAALGAAIAAGIHLPTTITLAGTETVTETGTIK
jgi:hypothetical protein